MSFWDTVAGNHLAASLEYNLPILAEALSKKQYTIECDSADAALEVVKNKVAAGDKYVSRIDADGRILIIMQEN